MGRATRCALGIGLGLVTAGGLSAQSPASVMGRVFDAETRAAIADAAIVVEGLGLGTVTNEVGLFHLPVVPPGDHVLRIQHLAYGDRSNAIRLRPGQDLTLRIHLSTSAIELRPLIVEARREEERTERARGTSRNIVSRDEIESMISANQTLDQVLVKNVTGIQVRASSRRGGDVCLEFRSPRSLNDPGGCKTPTVFLDGVRVSNPQPLWDTFPIEEIQRLEVIPGAAAGARFGADTNYGVLLIETRTGSQAMELEEVRPDRRRTYDWALESAGYPWLKVFAASFAGNAAGLAVGALVGQGCFQFEEGLANSHFFLESSCNRWATAGSAAALFGLPVTGAAFGANRAGRTDLSRGRWVPAAVASAIAVVPGYILVVAKDDESFSGSQVLGWGLLTVGVPLFTTIADRLFREFRSDPLGTLR